jgi:hypothetical protein
LEKRDRYRGKRAGLIPSGGNIDIPVFARILQGRVSVGKEQTTKLLNMREGVIDWSRMPAISLGGASGTASSMVDNDSTRWK